MALWCVGVSLRREECSFTNIALLASGFWCKIFLEKKPKFYYLQMVFSIPKSRLSPSSIVLYP